MNLSEIWQLFMPSMPWLLHFAQSTKRSSIPMKAVAERSGRHIGNALLLAV
jgi:hypothetical protein